MSASSAEAALTFAGTLVPLTLRALRLDPALASAVIVTTVTDCVGFWLFLGLATLTILELANVEASYGPVQALRAFGPGDDGRHAVRCEQPVHQRLALLRILIRDELPRLRRRRQREAADSL